MRRVVLESPYAGNIKRNVIYARLCIRDCLLRGESPIASHLLFTQDGILKDDVPLERKLGMDAGHAWMVAADACVVYVDFGLSHGMQAGIKEADRIGLKVEYRKLASVADIHLGSVV
jgi:hypothetical protein